MTPPAHIVPLPHSRSERTWHQNARGFPPLWQCRRCYHVMLARQVEEHTVCDIPQIEQYADRRHAVEVE